MFDLLHCANDLIYICPYKTIMDLKIFLLKVRGIFIKIPLISKRDFERNIDSVLIVILTISLH
jgi:hypothetical protein